MTEEFHNDWEVVPYDLNKEAQGRPRRLRSHPGQHRATARSHAITPAQLRPILPCSTSSHRTATAPTSQGTISQEGGHHQSAKVRFIPPKAAPEHAFNGLETPPKRRKTIVDIDEDVRRLHRVIIDLQSSVNSITRQLSNHNTVILGLRHDLASANKKIRELERR